VWDLWTVTLWDRGYANGHEAHKPHVYAHWNDQSIEYHRCGLRRD
jgi:hypothetical protein